MSQFYSSVKRHAALCLRLSQLQGKLKFAIRRGIRKLVIDTVFAIDALEVKIERLNAVAGQNVQTPKLAIVPDLKPQKTSAQAKVLVSIFGGCYKQYHEFLTIRAELLAIGVKVGKLIKSRDDVKGWRLDLNGDKAGLYWTISNGWEVDSLKYDTELTGEWEGFDLIQQLECNGIDLDELSELSA